MPLFQLVYISKAVDLFSDERLRKLVSACRRSNRKMDVTGLLMYQDGIFLQVLEGAEDVLRPLYEKISRDPRHRDAQIVLERTIPEREFSRWRMQLGILGDSAPDSIAHLDERVRDILRVADPDGEAAIQIMREFRDLDQQYSGLLTVNQ